MILEPLSAFKGCQAQSRYRFLFSQLQEGLITNHVEAAVLVPVFVVFVVVLSDNASLLITNHARGSATKILTTAPIILFTREGFVTKLRDGWSMRATSQSIPGFSSSASSCSGSFIQYASTHRRPSAVSTPPSTPMSHTTPHAQVKRLQQD